jgi:hypothetical protein
MSFYLVSPFLSSTNFSHQISISKYGSIISLYINSKREMQKEKSSYVLPSSTNGINAQQAERNSLNKSHAFGRASHDICASLACYHWFDRAL